MSELRQIVAVILIGLGSLRNRCGTAMVIVIGMASVVGVLTSMLSLTSGMTRAYYAPMTRDVPWSGRVLPTSIRAAASMPMSSGPSWMLPESPGERMAHRWRMRSS